MHSINLIYRFIIIQSVTVENKKIYFFGECMKKEYLLLFLVFSIRNIIAMNPLKLYRTIEQEEQAAIGEGNIKVISADGQDFILPRTIATQSETIKHLLGEIGGNVLTFAHISSNTLKEIGELLKILPEYKHLKNKALLDALEAKNIAIKNPIALLNAANYLDIPSIMHLAARMVAQQEKTRIAQESTIAKLFKKNNLTTQQLPKDMLTLVAHYYLLLADQKYPGTTAHDYAFSVQDYLDYQPNKIALYQYGSREKKVIHEELEQKSDPRADLVLSGLYINNLDGLQHIINKHRILRVFLDNNKLKSLTDSDHLADFFNLNSLYIQNNTLKEFAVHGLDKLQHLDLSSNKLIEIPQIILTTTLRSLNISHNAIAHINIFRNPFPTLQSLDLSWNPLKKIESNAFAGCINLANLSLYNTELTTIELHAFAGLRRITMFYINGNNQLRSISPEVFDSTINERVFFVALDTKISRDNIAALKRTFPNAIIEQTSIEQEFFTKT